MDSSKEEFERYLKGEMSEGEKHLFEKKLLDNPFEYEAMEGMEGFTSGQIIEDLATLNNLISNNQKEKGRSKYMLYRFAASIVLIATFSVLIYYFTSNESNKTLLSENTEIEEGLDSPVDTNTLSMVDPEKPEENHKKEFEATKRSRPDNIASSPKKSVPQQPELKQEELLESFADTEEDEIVVQNFEANEPIADIEEQEIEVEQEELKEITPQKEEQNIIAEVKSETEEINIASNEISDKSFAGAKARKRSSAISEAPTSAEPTILLDKEPVSLYSISFPEKFTENSLQPKDVILFSGYFNQNYKGPPLPQNLEIKLFSDEHGTIVDLKQEVELDPEIVIELEKSLINSGNWSPTIINGKAVADSVRVIIQ